MGFIANQISNSLLQILHRYNIITSNTTSNTSTSIASKMNCICLARVETKNNEKQCTYSVTYSLIEKEEEELSREGVSW